MFNTLLKPPGDTERRFCNRRGELGTEQARYDARTGMISHWLIFDRRPAAQIEHQFPFYPPEFFAGLFAPINGRLEQQVYRRNSVLYVFRRSLARPDLLQPRWG